MQSCPARMLLSSSPPLTSSQGGTKQKEDVPNADVFATKDRNDLIPHRSIADDKWQVAKKTRAVIICTKPSEEFMDIFSKPNVLWVTLPMDHICPAPCCLDWDGIMTSVDVLEHSEEDCCGMGYTTAGQL